MTTFSVTTAVNIDTLTPKTGGDTYTIDGGYLTIDQDSRYGVNATTSASIGNMTLSATLGGTVEINSTAVRLIPFDTGTGTVPAFNTVITNGTGSGKLIGVYADLVTAPLAAAASMPASGFIKVKQVTGAYVSGALTGISANATGADEPGWLEIVGQESTLLTFNRLNNLILTGDWYYFRGATTSGSNASTYQIPSNGSNVYAPGVWVETAVSSSVYEFYPCAGPQLAHIEQVATDAIRGKVCWINNAGQVRFQNDGYHSTGGYLPVSGLRMRIPNLFCVICTAATKTNNTIPNVTVNTRFRLIPTAGGNLTIEKASTNWYMSLTTPYTVVINNTAITHFLSITRCPTAINFNNIGIGQVGQYLQPIVNSTPLNFVTCFSSVTVTNSVLARGMMNASASILSASDCNDVIINNVNLQLMETKTSASATALTITRCTDSTITNTICNSRVSIVSCTNLTVTNTLFYDCTTNTTNFSVGPTRSATWTRVTTVATVTYTAHGFRVSDTLNVTVSSDAAAITVAAKTVATVVDANTFTFACLDAGAGSGTLSYARTLPSTLQDAVLVNSSCTNILIDGVHFGGLRMVQPFNAVVNVSGSGNYNVRTRNIGTSPSSCLDLGDVAQQDKAWTRVTTTATITTTDHGLKIGDILYVYISSASGAVSVGAKTVVTIVDANTFTFSCTNASATSGTLSYYPTVSNFVTIISANAINNNIKFQNIYATHNRANTPFTADSNNKDIVFESCYGDYFNTFYGISCAGVQKNIGGASSLLAATSTYDINWLDAHRAPAMASNSASWTRVTSTATITRSAHNLITGFPITVLTTSDGTAVSNGYKSTVTVLTEDTFTIACSNLGATSGTLTYEFASSRITLLMNENTVNPVYTIDSGTPAFTSAGGLYMPTVGQQITFETPYYIIGHTGFALAELVIGTATLSNYDFAYALDQGSGYGSWHNLSYHRAGGSGTSGQSTITVTNATGVEVGDYVAGTNVGWLAKVDSIASNTLTLSVANIGTVSGVIRFYHLPSETVTDASVGFKMKIRILTNTTNVLAIAYLNIMTQSTMASRAYTYPLDLSTVILTLSGIASGSEVRIYSRDGSGNSLSELSGNENVTSGIFTYTYTKDALVDVRVNIVVFHSAYQYYSIDNYLLTAAATTIPIQQIADRQYLNP